MDIRIGAMIKARLASSRFPGKHIQRLGDHSMIGQIVRKALELEGTSHVIIETTYDQVDDPLVEIAEQWGVECYRGHPIDLLDRDLSCMEYYGLTHSLQISGDCPMFDPIIAQQLIDAVYVDPKYDRYNPTSTYHVPMGGTTSSIVSYNHIEKYIVPLYIDHDLDEFQEQYWVIPLKHVKDKTVDCTDIMPLVYTPIETSVDYPLQLAVLNVVIDYLGHYPEDYAEVAKAFREIHALSIVPWDGPG